MNNGLYLSKTEYYAPIPIIKLDAEWMVSDINLANQILFDLLLHNNIEEIIKQSIDELKAKPKETDYSNDDTRLNGDRFKCATTASTQLHLVSKVYGAIFFKLVMIDLPKLDTMDILERTVYIEFDNNDFLEAFRTVFEKKLKRQLIWATYAVSYDEILQVMDYYVEVVNRHCNALGAPGIDKIIDLGAGTGNVTIPLLKMGRSVTAIDMSRAMLDKMHSKILTLDSPKVMICQQSAENLAKFTDESFDGVNILLALFDMSDPTAAINEAIRVLRPSGVLVVTEPKRNFDLLSLLSHAEQFLIDNGLFEKLRYHWKCVTGVNKQIDPSVRSTRLYIEDIQEILIKSNFNITNLQDSHYGNCATLWAKKSI